MRHFYLIFALLGPTCSAAADELPGCAALGSKTVVIGGKPALRLSDVVMCPADTYEIISSMQIDGQPMVRFKPVHFGKTRCAILSDGPTVTAEDRPIGHNGGHCSSH